MLTIFKLNMIRLKQHMLHYYKILRSICDWTVWLYIITPPVIVFIGFYREWWDEIPRWALTIPWDYLSLIIISLMTCRSHITICVEDADQIILLQKPKWLLSLKRFGLLYSWLMLQLVILIIPLMLLPFLVLVSEWTSEQIIMLLGHASLSSIIALILNHRSRIAAPWWKKWLMNWLMYLVNSTIIIAPMLLYLEHISSYWIGMSIYLIVALVMIRQYAITPINFHQQLSREKENKLKFTTMILSQSIELTNTSKRKTPIVFRKSQRLYRHNDLNCIIGELYFKSLVRDFGQLKVWLMFLGVSCLALTQIPGFAPFIVIILLMYIATLLFNLQWEQWCRRDFISSYIRFIEYKLAARKKARNPLIALFTVIWLILAIVMQLL